jgi:MoxR-like ATPase
MSESKFQGKYVQEMKSVLTASALSGVHTTLMGKPGRGKTAICRAMANAIFDDRHVFMRFNPTTPPEKVLGMPDMGKLLTENVYELVTTGTFYDELALNIVADEVYRAHDAIFDVLIDSLDRQDIDQTYAPVVWCTSNFAPTSDRTAALRDRIGLVWWDPNETLDAHSIVMNQLTAIRTGLSIGDSLPTIDDVLKAREAEPGDNAKQAIATFIANLSNEAQKGYVENETVVARFEPNPRRWDQWGKILFRYSFHLTGGDSDFSEIPPEAKDIMRFAWPSVDEQESLHWQALCEAIADPMEAALNVLLTNAYGEFQKLLSDNPGVDHQAIANELGKLLADQQREINDFANTQGIADDPRVDKVLADLQHSFAEVVGGRNPFE